MGRTLTYPQARSFYDGFGAKQDDQAWYEDAATARIIAHAHFESARLIVELGCGTGRFAQTVLRDHAGEQTRYLGTDLSSTMIALARERLEPFGERVTLERTEGEPSLPAPDASADRFVSNYVLDLLSDDDIRAVVAEAHRVLMPGGLLCLASLTFGRSLWPVMTTLAWRFAHWVQPRWVGGCRPIRIEDYLGDAQFETIASEVVEVKGLASEVYVGRKV